MKFLLTLILITSLAFPIVDLSAATKYTLGKKWGCYTFTKSKKTGKSYKKYVDIKFCKKK